MRQPAVVLRTSTGCQDPDTYRCEGHYSFERRLPTQAQRIRGSAVAMTIDASLIEGFMIGFAPGIFVGIALTLIGARWIYHTAWWAEIEKRRRGE